VVSWSFSKLWEKPRPNRLLISARVVAHGRKSPSGTTEEVGDCIALRHGQRSSDWLEAEQFGASEQLLAQHAMLRHG
jgi:hypothetical protein